MSDNITLVIVVMALCGMVVSAGIGYLLGENERLRAILARRRRWRVGR